MTFSGIDHTHDPQLACWVEGAEDHLQFPIQNLPYGIFSNGDDRRRQGIAIGAYILDLAPIADHLPINAELLQAPVLNALFAQPTAARLALRHKLSELLCDEASQVALSPHLFPTDQCKMHLPMSIGDYTDFYVGIHHATNVGKLFRPDNPLLPNYKYVPTGYHGRASSVRPSGMPVRRPAGQRKPPDMRAPVFGPTERLDYELELGIWIGAGNELGEPIAIDEAAEHIAGFCLLNDWSARDFQAWEYVPLGPFLSKNFHTTISPWVVSSEAMAPFRIAQPHRPECDPRPLDYLWNEVDQGQGALGVELEVLICTAAMRQAGMEPERLSKGHASNMYWTAQQIVTHHASNGCNLASGDLFGTGTISTQGFEGYGSLIELTHGGASRIALPTGEERAFVEDGDEILLRAVASAKGFKSIGFGECRAIVQPPAASHG